MRSAHSSPEELLSWTKYATPCGGWTEESDYVDNALMCSRFPLPVRGSRNRGLRLPAGLGQLIALLTHLDLAQALAGRDPERVGVLAAAKAHIGRQLFARRH